MLRPTFRLPYFVSTGGGFTPTSGACMLISVIETMSWYPMMPILDALIPVERGGDSAARKLHHLKQPTGRDYSRRVSV